MSHDSTERIVRELLAWITGAAPGAQLPTSRELVTQFGASPVTVQKALRRLADLGHVEARPGVGTFVRASAPAPVRDFGWQTAALGPTPNGAGALSSAMRSYAPESIALHSGYPAAALLPARLVSSALVRAARGDAALRRPVTAGMPDLRAWFTHELASAAPASVAAPTARDALIVAGSQSGISAAFRSIVGRGNPVLVESPTYWGAIIAARQAGVTLVPVASGPGGPDPDDVERAFAQSGARAFYAQPAFANPTGATWSATRAQRILEIVRDAGAFLIEDDWARDLPIDDPPAPLAARVDTGHVIYLRSLTKAASPALRVAVVIARGPARDRLLADIAAESMYVSEVLQTAALDVVTHPAWRTHLRTIRGELRQRRDTLIDALTRDTPELTLTSIPTGGHNLWARLADGTDVDAIVRAAESRGLIIAAGTEWFPAEPPAPYLRLNYAAEDPHRFADAARILGEVIRAA